MQNALHHGLLKNMLKRPCQFLLGEAGPAVATFVGPIGGVLQTEIRGAKCLIRIDRNNICEMLPVSSQIRLPTRGSCDQQDITNNPWLAAQSGPERTIDTAVRERIEDERRGGQRGWR